jgi:hypothetical protein
MSIPRYTVFFETVTGMTLTPAQRVADTCAFEGLNPSDLGADSRALAREMFGGIEKVPGACRRVIVTKKGARIGGTLRNALRVLHLGLTVDVSRLAPGEAAYGVIVGPDMRLAGQAFRFIEGAIDRTPYLAGMVVSRTTTSITIRREDRRLIVIECLPASVGGSAIRGRSLCCLMMTEGAFFRDEQFAVNDVEIYRAGLPRVLPGGQVLIESTPWASMGLLHELFSANWAAPTTGFAMHCPTLLMRGDDPQLVEDIARERERDQDNARREFDAQFLDAGTGAFFDAAAIDQAVDVDRTDSAPKRDGALVTAGADFGFRNDSSALAIVQALKGTFHVDHLAEVRPSKGSPLKPSAVVRSFAQEARPYGCDTLIADSHYRESINEHLEAAGLFLQSAPEGQAGKAETYVRARALINEGRVRLPNNPRLIRQLKEVVSTPTPGGGLSISSPRWRSGGHGDLVSALVLAIFVAARNYFDPQPIEQRPAKGTAAYDAWLAERQEAASIAAEEASIRNQNEAAWEQASGEWWENPEAAMRELLP